MSQFTFLADCATESRVYLLIYYFSTPPSHNDAPEHKQLGGVSQLNQVRVQEKITNV